MKKDNEQSACEAFISILKALTGIHYVKRASPDELNRQTPEIDFLLVSIIDESDRIAAEHTTVESFDGQIGYVNRSFDVVAQVNAACKKKIPADRYYWLSIPPVLVDSLTGVSRRRFVSNLSAWVADTAQELMIDSHKQTGYEGHKITLMCSGADSQLNGNIWRMPQQPENHDILQTQRLRRAIGSKLPRLERYKKRGFKTALLLEAIADMPSTITQRGHGMSSDEKSRIRSTIDYIVIFGSNKDRMIIGNVWKEKSTWHSSIPDDKKFSFRQIPGKGTSLETGL